MEALLVCVVENAALRPALEHHEAEASIDEARQRLMGILVRSFEEELVFAGKEGVGVRERVPPFGQRLLGNWPQRVDRDERLSRGAECRQQSALNVERHRRKMEGRSGAPS